MCGDDAVLHRGRHAHDTRARLGASEGASPVIHLQVLVAQRTRAGGGTDESRHVCCLCDLRAWRVLVSTSLHMRNVVPMRDVRR